MRVARTLSMLAAWLLVALALRTEATSAPRLPALQADLAQTTVSGLSSGAYMAGQFAVIHSSLVTGVGLIAGGPYYCAGRPGRPPFIAYLANAMSVCMNPQQAGTDPPDAVLLWEQAQAFARAGLIDQVAHLRRQSVYLFSGSADRTVTTVVVDQARNFHALAGASRILYRDNLNAGHGMVTADPRDHPCPLTAAPYFNNCKLTLARELLAHLYPGLGPPSATLSGTVLRFDQRPYAGHSAGLADTGYVYVPEACRRQSCRVHVAFHGCRQGAGLIGDRFYRRAGYNEVADANRLIVLYPQVRTSRIYPFNPRGCWDYWGYSSANPFDPEFHTRDGAQVKAVFAMVQRLAALRFTENGG